MAKNYFFKPNWEHERKMQESGVAAYPMDIDGSTGVILDEENFQKAIVAFGQEIVAESKTSLEGIYSIVFKAAGATSAVASKVFIESWNGDGNHGFADAARSVLCPVVGDVVLHVPHGRSCRVISDGKFHIIIWSSPVGEHHVSTPAFIWNTKVSCRDAAFASSGQGETIYSDDYAVAELVDNCLYIHHDICHHGTDAELTIFRRVLEECVRLKTMTPEEIMKVKQEKEEEEKRLSRQRYIDECAKRLKGSINELKEKVASGTESIKSLEKKLVETIRVTKEAEQKLFLLLTCNGPERERYGLEYDKLLSVAHVQAVIVRDSKIIVTTDKLYCADPRSKKLHEIGAFRIEIRTDGNDECVRWFNLDHRIDGYKSGMQAPHVFPEGNACLGSAKEIFPSLIASYEYAAVAMVAIQFIESVNTDDDAGKHIDRWPLAPKEMQTAEAKKEIKRVKEMRKNNPFLNVESDLSFVKHAKKADPGTKLVNCGPCWCFGGNVGKCDTSEIAKALGVKNSQVKEILAAYFKI